MRILAFLLMMLSLGSCGKGGDEWTLSRSGDKTCYKVSVPSTVAGALDAAGYFKTDLMTGRSYADVDKTVFEGQWIYRKKFSASPVKDRRYELVFDGLNYYADIFLNGKQIASSDTTFGVFIRRAYDVTGLLKRRNALEVRLRPARKGDLNIGFVDWNPRPLDESMGIVRPVSLRETGAISLEDVYVIPHLNVETLSEADLEVRVRLHNHADTPVEGRLTLDVEGVGSFEVPVAMKAGETGTRVFTRAENALLHLENPRLWWSWDLGTPELYRLSAKVMEGGKQSDSRAVTFGVRDITSRITPEGYRQFTLNGRDFLLKGAGWTDDIFLRDTPESIARQVDYVKDMNLNCIRFENIWGKDDTVYDLCDSLGVLALVGWSCQWEWEDYCGLPETKGYGCINDPASEDLAVRYFRDQVVRLHNHVSIIGWMTGSDRIPNPRLEARYMEIYQAEEYRPYICSAKQITSTYGGPSGTKMEGPYEYVGPDYWYIDKKYGGAFGFNTETGIGANLPQLESIKRMIPEDALWPLSADWDYHCTAASSAMNTTAQLLEVAEGLYGPVTSLEDFVLKAHAVDYNGTRAMFESFRVRRPVATGIVQWMLNSAWPSLYWQLYDWYGVPTAGYYGTRKACEGVQLIFDYADRKVYAVNGTADAADLDAKIRIYDDLSALNFDGDFDVHVEPGVSALVADLSRFDGVPHFVFLELTGKDGKKVTDNFYALGASDNEYKWKKSNWYITPITAYSDLRFVFSGEAPDVEMSVGGGDGSYEITVSNKTQKVVCTNLLKAVDGSGHLAVPAFWSDNFFALPPGGSKTVTCRTDGKPVHFEMINR